MNEYPQWIEQLLQLLTSFVPVSILAWIGGMAKYFHDLLAGKQKHTWSAFFAYSGLTCLTGIIVGEFIPDDIQMRDGFVALSGVCAFQLLSVMEETGTSILKKFISRDGK